MADDAKEAAKKKAFYHQQRLDAESKAEGGDRDAAGMAKRINAKTGNFDKAKHYSDIQQFGRTGAKIAGGIDTASDLAGTAASFIGPRGAAGAIGAARGLFPKAAEGVAKLLGRYGPKGAAKAAPQAAKTAAKVAGDVAKGTTKKSSLAGTGRTVKAVSNKGKVVRTSPGKTTPMSGAAKSKPTGQSIRPLQAGTKKAQRFVERQGNKGNPPKSSVSRKKTAKNDDPERPKSAEYKAIKATSKGG